MAWLRREETQLIAITVLCALLIAASDVGQFRSAGLASLYAYWLMRLLIEAALFVAFREIIEKFAPANTSQVLTCGLAIILSLFPFVLAITTFDIVLGLPELGLQNAAGASSSRVSEFGLELVFLFDNHLFFCLLLCLPRLWLSLAARTAQTGTPGASSFLADLSPPLEGDVLWAEAQEHYVRLTTQAESRLVLYRFSDILRELPEAAGMQVHRSHWISFSAIAASHREGANLRLKLVTGDTVPVSRSFRNRLEEALRRA